MLDVGKKVGASSLIVSLRALAMGSPKAQENGPPNNTIFFPIGIFSYFLSLFSFLPTSPKLRNPSSLVSLSTKLKKLSIRRRLLRFRQPPPPIVLSVQPPPPSSNPSLSKLAQPPPPSAAPTTVAVSSAQPSSAPPLAVAIDSSSLFSPLSLLSLFSLLSLGYPSPLFFSFGSAAAATVHAQVAASASSPRRFCTRRQPTAAVPLSVGSHRRHIDKNCQDFIERHNRGVGCPRCLRAAELAAKIRQIHRGIIVSSSWPFALKYPFS
ncbi:pectinesterase inhibitor 10-like [Salvia splendens]|uniref:pectinesterase inhibitor 10-like n=1 Tax=Salvia splendens TaxID=180675 RepID=UPI001C25BA30|nr:pectinesterase inhibitor 10-like [Salvia splendens]